MPKTDVIFLGAGASCCAKFPTNENLTKYIIESLPQTFEKRLIFNEGNLWRKRLDEEKGRIEGLVREWTEVAESLRKSKLLSVDEYCQISAREGQNDIVHKLKKILRLALMQHMDEWSGWNLYGKLIYSLFHQSEYRLDDRFTVVNFNYDGLFGKLLVDAVLERHKVARIRQMPEEDEIAAIAGGFYSDDKLNGIIASQFPPNKFGHYMPVKFF